MLYKEIPILKSLLTTLRKQYKILWTVISNGKMESYLRKPPFGLEVVFRWNLEILEIQIFGKFLSSSSNNYTKHFSYTPLVHHAFNIGNSWKISTLPTPVTSGKSRKGLNSLSITGPKLRYKVCAICSSEVLTTLLSVKIFTFLR